MTTLLETTVTAVTVYLDRARVTRAGRVAVEPGPYRLEIPELPLTLSPESVRASGKGTARARLGGVDVQRTFFTETPAARAAELENLIEEIKDQEKALADEEQVLKTALTYLGGLAQQGESYGKGLAFGKSSVEESAELLEFITTRSTAAQDRLRAINLQRRESKRKEEKLQNELNQIANVRSRQRYTAIVEVEVSTAGELNIELTYVVSNAGWTPLYDLRLAEGNQETQEPGVEIDYLAQITQRSGEDWLGAQLTLSTARPALSATLPELNPWYLQIYRPPPAPMMVAAAPSPARKMAAKFAEAEEPTSGATLADFAAEVEPVEMEVAQAEVSQEGGAVTFTVTQPVDVPSDGSPHKTSIATLPLRPELDYLTAPKLVSAAYRRATITNDTAFVLLPGPVNIFYGNEFVGTTKMQIIAPNESFKVFLGADDRIKVERKLVTQEVDKRFIGDKRRLRYAYQIDIKNLRDTTEKVIIQDQLPVPRHEDIKVRAEEILPKPDKQTDLGLLEWEQNLESQQEVTITFAFAIEHPRDLTVTGLP